MHHRPVALDHMVRGHMVLDHMVGGHMMLVMLVLVLGGIGQCQGSHSQ
jgi:hypothetical protein